jgi:hypothetical protein
MASKQSPNAEERLLMVEEKAREALEAFPESQPEISNKAVRDFYQYVHPLWQAATAASQWDERQVEAFAKQMQGTVIGLRAGLNIMRQPEGGPQSFYDLFDCIDSCYRDFDMWATDCSAIDNDFIRGTCYSFCSLALTICLWRCLESYPIWDS